MDLKLTHFFVNVHDHEEALAFYRDVLGFEVRVDARLETMRWLTVGPKSQPDIELGLSVPDELYAPAAAGAMKDIMAMGLLTAGIFKTEDCDATFERVRASGAEVLQEPIDQPYGVRDCAFRDPSGNAIRFSEVLKV
ncbi:VOC family protein [Rhizohabitans arisaemae]|uniref:VOC family protein n=1 Tax=Rhizohabitans arisaemae TaxID=2720610 RepID=UPI0024B0F836|nr:VOC family protein [Rhizohabitans arisaemae]